MAVAREWFGLADFAPARSGILKRNGFSAYAWHMPTGGRSVPVERRVKVFRNGRNQAVRIPREFELPGDEAVIRKEGKRLVIEPAPTRSLLAVLARLKPLKDAFPPIQDKPPGPVAI